MYVIGRAIEGLFKRAHGFHIHVWDQIDSRVRVITARRNPNMLIFMVFCIFGDPVSGLAAVAIWSVACNVFHAVRLAQAGLATASALAGFALFPLMPPRLLSVGPPYGGAPYGGGRYEFVDSLAEVGGLLG